MRRSFRRWMRRVELMEAALFLIALFFAIFIVHALVSRALWERDRTVEICVDGEEVRSLSDADDDRTFSQLLDLAERGVQSVAVYWDPAYPLSGMLREWEPRVPGELAVTLRPEVVPFSDWRHRWPRAARAGRDGPLAVNHVLFSGPSVLGYPETAATDAWIASSTYRLPWLEFTRQRGMRALAGRFPERLVRGHTMTEDEMATAGVERVIARYRRAVRERGVRWLYVRFFPGISSEENFEFVARLARTLEADGFRMGTALSRWADYPMPYSNFPAPLRQALALLAAIAGPLLGMAWALRRPVPWYKAFLRFCAASIGTALVVAAFLSAREFVLGLEIFRGVKTSLLVPIAAAIFYLYRAREIRHFLEEPLNVERLLLGLAFLGAAAVYLLRSGHGTPVDASGSELYVRGMLESALGLRPRFKEFFIGHPLLLLGLYLHHKFPHGQDPFKDRPGFLAQVLHFAFLNWRPFVLAGFVGQLSIVNTFCHAHAPLHISLLRTFHGLWLGVLGGCLLIGLFRFFHRRWTPLPV